MHRVALLLVALVGCRSASPAEVVDRFYRELRTQQVTGAPTPDQLMRLSPYLGDSLEKLLTEARRQHDADLAREPNEKPAFAEGDLFSSLFEGPSSVKAETGAGERVLVHMSRDSTRWTDTILVGTENGKVVIQDIRFGGTWDFALKGTLRAQLSGTRAGP